MDQPDDGTTVDVTTSLGTLRGAWHSDIARFAGIRFAEPPVGKLRFRPPEPVKPWEDVRAASDFGTIAPQNASMMDALFGGESEQWDEDCLFLNVWTPDPDPDTPLPVMVWIHGGGFEMGSGSSPLYDGTSFARNGVVYVSLNYRLGAFGFLDLGAVDPDLAGSGNLGLMDQIAALEWVRDNISAFGGDPDQVTVFGESAGAMSISLLLSIDRTSGLFTRAITQSGTTAAARSPEAAAEDTAEFMGKVGCSSVEELLAAGPEQLLAAHATMAAERVGDPESVIKRSGNPFAFLSFRPVADGALVPTDPEAAIAAGAAAGVDLLAGSNTEEWKLFALASPPPADEAALRKRFSLVVSDPDAAIAAYRDERGDISVSDLECALLTDLVFRIPACREADAQAAHAEVWQYLWAWRSPAFGGMIGASHALEIPFVFDLIEDHRLHVFVGADAPRELAAATHAAWVAFARTGDPSGGSLGDWPTVDSEDRPVMVLDTESQIVNDPEGATRRFWATDAAAPPRR